MKTAVSRMEKASSVRETLSLVRALDPKPRAGYSPVPLPSPKGG